LSDQKVASFQIDEEKHLKMDTFPLKKKRMIQPEYMDETDGSIIMGEENRHYFISESEAPFIKNEINLLYLNRFISHSVSSSSTNQSTKMSIEPVRYIYKGGLYENYTRSINPREEPLKSLCVVVRQIFDSNRYDIKIHPNKEEMEAVEPFITVKQKEEYIKIASFETMDGDIVMNIFPKPGKEILGSQEFFINNVVDFQDIFWNTVDEYTFDIQAFLDAPYPGRSEFDEYLFRQEQMIDDELDYKYREEEKVWK
jgi:hypothetical protein